MVDPDGRRPPCGKRSSHSARVFSTEQALDDLDFETEEQVRHLIRSRGWQKVLPARAVSDLKEAIARSVVPPYG
jgi:hypothetical protein